MIPLNNYLLVKPLPIEAQGLVKTTQRDKPTKGEIIQTNDNTKLQTGDIVFFPTELGVPIEIEGAEYLLLRENELYAFVKSKSGLLQKIEENFHNFNGEELTIVLTHSEFEAVGADVIYHAEFTKNPQRAGTKTFRKENKTFNFIDLDYLLKL
jgi:co-chaperonin GroES (HSP10)